MTDWFYTNYKRIKRILISIIVFFSVFIAVEIAWGPSYSKIIGNSMFPTLISGDSCITISKFNKIERGDVVIIDLLYMDIIKRVIGIPGDTIIIIGGDVYINQGIERTMELVFYETDTPKPLIITLKENEYFVLGDNRQNSRDSRYFGPVKKEMIIRKAILHWHPLTFSNSTSVIE